MVLWYRTPPENLQWSKFTILWKTSLFSFVFFQVVGESVNDNSSNLCMSLGSLSMKTFLKSWMKKFTQTSALLAKEGYLVVQSLHCLGLPCLWWHTLKRGAKIVYRVIFPFPLYSQNFFTFNVILHHLPNFFTSLQVLWSVDNPTPHLRQTIVFP